MKTFLDVWRSEIVGNYLSAFTAGAVSEQTVHKFASLIWSSAMKARDELDEEMRQAYQEEGERD